MSGLSLCPAVQLWFAGKTVSSGPAPLPFAALAVLGLPQRWRVGFGPAALGAGEEAFSFRLWLLFFLQTWVWVRKGQAFFLLPLELQWTVAQNLGTSYISSHPLFRVHCVNHLHICNPVNAPLLSAQRRVESEFQRFERQTGPPPTAGSCLWCWSFPSVCLHHYTELDCIFSFQAFSFPQALDKTNFRIVNISPYHGPRETLSDISFGILFLGSSTVTQVSLFVFNSWRTYFKSLCTRMQPPVIDETKNAIRNWLVESTP